MDNTEPKVCWACYEGMHCRGLGRCECACRNLDSNAANRTPAEWAEQEQREAPIREAMRRVERDYIEREKRAKS